MPKAKAETAAAPAKAELRTMVLPVALTDAEVAIRAQEGASKEAELHDAEQRLTRYLETAKEGKKNLENEIGEHRFGLHRLAEAVRTRKEPRDVTVVEESDFEAGAVHTIRPDTGEVVATRGMSFEERQRALFRDVRTGGKES